MRVRSIYITVALLSCVVGILWCTGNGSGQVPVSTPTPVDLTEVERIVVLKGKRSMEIYAHGRVVKRYRIGLGSRPIGDKIRQGDRRTPEGIFHIRIRNPRSNYYLSLGIDYPNIEDARRGLRNRVIDRETHDRIITAIDNGEMPPQNTALGGDIYIHGNGSHRDWTWGCVALDDRNMKELFDAVPLGTAVEIRK
jgi:murein L,D-transpeptidase YafK